MRNIAIQQKGQVQEVQVAVKDAAQEAQEARVNCEEANVSQKLLLKDVEKKVKMKMKKKKFCSLLPNKKPYKPNKPHLFNKPNNAKWPNKPNKPHLFNKPNKAKRPNGPTNPTNPTYSTNPTTVCPSPSITTISTISTSTKPAKPNN